MFRNEVITNLGGFLWTFLLSFQQDPLEEKVRLIDDTYRKEVKIPAPCLIRWGRRIEPLEIFNKIFSSRSGYNTSFSSVGPLL